VQHQIKLEQNYRSFSNILDSANALISQNTRRLGKNLRTDQGAGEPVRVMESPSDFAEAQWMVDEIKQLHRDGMALTEQAVLYRSNAQSRVIETALFNAGLPYKVYGGLRFFERAEIKHALAYLRLLENPADDTSFLRVANFPPRGIGARSMEQLQDAAQAADTSLHAAAGTLKGAAAVKIGAFVARLDVLREQTQQLSLREIVELVLQHSGLIEHYRADREGEDRLENLDELVNAAESFVTQEGFGKEAIDFVAENADDLPENLPNLSENLPNSSPVALADTGETLSPLAAFLSHAALESGDTQAGAGQDAVQLMTVHSSKGLEFDCVFIGGLEEGLFPHENSLSSQDGLEEERRLMYVAITRARRRLYLSHSQTRLLHGQTRYNVQSRFFEELPAHALKWISTRSVRHAYTGARSGWGASAPLIPMAESDAVTRRVHEVMTAASGSGWRSGDRVFHNKFGEGRVLQVEGSGTDARAQIEFPRHGVKWLALSIAKLTPLP
jgi:DNA helicase-2/ATP-dependent DNA helicase PcrA